ncbi:hypothetical protein [Maritimibacter sp. DP1N21-5]|uniref:hypothetical protein n=1 Tax=Maritimibacter sp. DP1N21-5 TaxID=2836867 RepID=UPI001C481991|nr:hypothetical protein [Maritimibacter sp. DP1N21-5]MBV7410649.1 hypothetical protein [Maritimibacter sp. DP1N21-5]
MFTLVDTANPAHDLVLVNRLWRPLMREIRRAGLVQGERATAIGYHNLTAVSLGEAQAIYAHFSALLDRAELPTDVDLDTAERFSSFAGRSQGFEIT